jgi:hypothetical protein
MARRASGDSVRHLIVGCAARSGRVEYTGPMRHFASRFLSLSVVFFAACEGTPSRDGGSEFIPQPVSARSCGAGTCSASQLCVSRGSGGIPWPCADAGVDGGAVCSTGSHPTSGMGCGFCSAVFGVCCALDPTCVDWSPSSCAQSCASCPGGSCNAGACDDVCPGECATTIGSGSVQCGGGA